MKVTVIKEGRWAEGGTQIRDIKKGEQELSHKLANELLMAGWAVLPGEVVEKLEPVQAPEVKQADTQTNRQTDKQTDGQTKPSIIFDENKRFVESIKKGKAGWWEVKFEGVKDVVKVRGADDEKEAETLAIAKLEVSE